MATTTIARPKRRLRLPRYSMATMFGFVTIICVILGLVFSPAERQKRAVEALRPLDNFHVYYDYEYTVSDDDYTIPYFRNISPYSNNNGNCVEGVLRADVQLPGPAWLRETIGVDYFADVVYVDFADLSFDSTRELQPDDLHHLRDLKNLEVLFLSATCVTDREVDCFASLPKLRSLYLSNTKVSDVGFAKLSAATNLRKLDLWKSRITDDALGHLAKLPKLQSLNLGSCKISDAGLAKLSTLTELRDLNLWETQITDDGLRHLAGHSQLTRLSLRFTKITGDGLRHLKSMPSLRVLTLSRTSVSDADLIHLHGLKQLNYVELFSTEVTQEGAEALRKALPKCKVLWAFSGIAGQLNQRT